LIEALALGLPALVSASGGNVDIVTPDTTGLLFAPDDASDLAGQLRNLLRADLCMAPPEAIRHSVEARRPAIVAQHYRDLYQRIQILHADPSSGFTKAAGPGGAPDTPDLGQRPPEP
jgi:glycosyltransferase involved in cell wall biosynthesis